MAVRDFFTLIGAQWAQKKFLCVGLDSEYEKLPEHIRDGGIHQAIVRFNRDIVDATKDIAGAYKPNMSFYEAHGEQGLGALEETVEYIREVAPDTPIILDAKRADIGNTNAGYVRAIFDELRADAVTVHPYLGSEALAPFFERKEKGVFVLCRTSNPGAGELQDLQVDGEPLFKVVASLVAEKWNANGNCGVVVGATYPDELAQVRSLIGDMPILIPGVGAQGGDIETSVKAAKNRRGDGFIISASRAIIFNSGGKEFATAAREKALEIDGAIRRAL